MTKRDVAKTLAASREATVRPLGASSQSFGISRFILGLARRVKESDLTQPFLARAFRRLQNIGINVTPNHYYWPIPDLKDLEKRDWRFDPNPAGVDLGIGRQLEFLENVIVPYQAECSFPEEPGSTPWEYHHNNRWFEAVDAEVAYAMVRHFKPRKIIEIGGGFSTRVLAQAIRENDDQYGFECELTTIEPYPDKILRSGIPGVTALIEKPAQDVDLELFLGLRNRDMLFIDSSHVVRVGGDVVYEYLDILPRLQPGVVVHLHDIFLPSDYPQDFVFEGLCFWSEQYLLQAFLSFNRDYEVIWGSSAMQQFHSQELENAIPAWRNSYSRMPKDKRIGIPTADKERVWPSSFWIRRVQHRISHDVNP